VRRRWVSVGCVLVIALFLSSVAATAATSLFGTRFKAGETIQFEVEDSTMWSWGCCCCSCTTTSILGWRIMDTAGQTIYSVVHDAPVNSTVWTGSWAQMNVVGSAVPSGQYVLYVDTSIGTLSRCFTIYDPCACCGSGTCYSCVCDQVSSITDCRCKATLVFVDTCTSGCFPFFGLFGCYSSPCGGGCP
jgi:hypothetical protein